MVSSTLKTIGQKKSNFSDLGGKECQKLGQEHEHSCYSDTAFDRHGMYFLSCDQCNCPYLLTDVTSKLSILCNVKDHVLVLPKQ